jgi:putative ABC transport system permease protein
VPGLRYTLRSLWKQPGFCVSAILTLALGIGANTAMFSVFDAVVLHPLPYRDPSRLVLVWQTLPTRAQNPVLALNYVEWCKRARSFERLLAMRNLFVSFRSGSRSQGGGETQQLLAGQVSRGFFTALGLSPNIGREFLPGDETSDHDRVAVVSYKLWRREFGADRHALGASLILNGESYTLIGVAPPNFDESLALRGVEIWTPLSLQQSASLRSNNMGVIGRLKPSVTVEEANREMHVIAERLESEFPDVNRGWSARVTALEDYGIGKLRATIEALLIAVGMVLLIACVNVANLLLARSDARHKEAGIRAALGASHARLLRQLLTETTLLAFAGSLAGIALAYGGLHALIALPSVQLPGLGNAGLNGRVLAFTIAVTALTGLLFGLLPARQVLGGNLNQAVRESGRSAINTRRGRGSRNFLVISEIALSLILLVGAGLMIRSALWLQNENRGFVSDRLLTFRASFQRTDFPNAPSMAAYYLSLLDRIAALPGVRSVGANTNLPIDGFMLVGQFFRLPGVPPPPSERPIGACNLVNNGFFRALGIPLVQGREFDTRDREDSPPVAIVSSSLARRYFPGENPIGRKLIVATPGKSTVEVSREIVGVAGDVRYLTRPSVESLEIYLPYVQTTWPNLYVMIRTTGDPASLAPQLRAVLRDPGSNRQSIADLTTMQDRISALNDKPRLNSLLAALFAGIALLLAGIGIYGVVSCSTSRRAKEIGLRMALGATPRDIVRWILGQALLLAIAGMALGLVGYFALSRVLASLLYGAGANDGWSLSLAVLTLGAIALVASYIPARRAVRGDPAAALRSE